jgi:hypothetical protein
VKVDGRTQLVLGVAAIGLLVAAAFLVSYMFAPLAILVAFMVVFGAVDRAQ